MASFWFRQRSLQVHLLLPSPRGVVRRFPRPGVTPSLTVAGTVAAALIATAAVWLLDTTLTAAMVRLVAERAADQVRLAVLSDVQAADFQPPYTSAKFDAFGRR